MMTPLAAPAGPAFAINDAAARTTLNVPTRFTEMTSATRTASTGQTIGVVEDPAGSSPARHFPVEHAQLDLVEERAVEAGGGRGVGTGPSLRHCAGVAALAGIRTGEFAAAREGHADAMLYH